MNLSQPFFILWGMVIAGCAGLLALLAVYLIRRGDE